MKKEMLILMAICCLLPININAICFKYVSGPKNIQSIIVEVDSTKVGSYLPTEFKYVEFIYKDDSSDDSSYRTSARQLIKTKKVYVTVKWSKNIVDPKVITLTKGSVELDNKAAYDITIEDDMRVTFKQTNKACPKAPLRSFE